jgi:glycosyltransferase involved in cell wall biosynthesis
MPEPRVDVIVPTYGSPDFLAEAIESVLAQTFAGFRLTVFDNGPGGGAAHAIVAPYLSDPRLRYDATGKVLSQRENWTRCIRSVTGPYVAMLHDDDLWQPEMLERRVAFLDAHSECGFVFSSMRDIDEHGDVVREIPHRLSEGVHQPHDFVPLLLEEMIIGSPTPLVRRSAYEDVGLEFTGHTSNNIDWDMWLRIALRHPVGYLALRDCERRVHGASLTSAGPRWGAEELRVLDRFEALVAQELPDVHWPQRARRRRRAHGHLIETFDAIERGATDEARTHLAAALRAHPPAVLDPRVPAALVALGLGQPGRRALAWARHQGERQGIPLHLSELRRLGRDLALRLARG